MAVNGDAPITERGTAVSTVYNWTGVLPWSQFMDDAEKSPDLQWPRSIEWYDQMRNDAQCQGLYLGATAALRRYGWYIDPNECDPFYTDLLAADLNLVVGEDEARAALESGNKSARLRSQGRFGWYQHLGMCLRAMYYGHFYFEQVGEVRPDGPNGAQVWRLRKLGPRHPRTITEIKVADDGGLVSITQGYGTAGMPPPEIPVDRLVAYIWDQDPGNWVGRSMYRPMYRNWLVKDRLLRVDAIKHERNGVGMPIIEAPPGATRADIQDLDNMAQEYKVGERGGGAVPYQTRLRLVGTEGSIPDTIGSIRFHNEEMARSMLMMFMQLGQTETGSRALGQSFIDWFQEQQTYIADWVVATTVNYVIEDWWNWNVDPAAPRTPLLGYVRDEQSKPTVGDFAGAQLPQEVADGLNSPAAPAAPLEGARPTPPERGPPRLWLPRQVRGQGGLPPLPGDQGEPVAAQPTQVPFSLPNRKLHRQPYPHEITAQADFGGIEEDSDAAESDTNKAWKQERQGFLEWIAEAIAGAKSAKEAQEEFYKITGKDAEEEFAQAGDAARAEAVRDAYEKGWLRAQGELVRQGLTRAGSWAPVALAAFIASPLDDIAIAAAVGMGLRGTLNGNAGRLLGKLQSAFEDTQELAEEVYKDLISRQEAWASDTLKGMINTATNRSRIDIFAQADEDGADMDLYASELLDINTCPACAYIDGRTLTKEEAYRLYAGGGYINCDGGPRCRGTVVAVYNGERSY